MKAMYSDAIVRRVRSEDSVLKAEIEKLENHIKSIQLELDTLPDGKRLYLQQRMGLEKDIVDTQSKIKILKRQCRFLIHDAREMFFSRQRGCRKSVSKIGNDNNDDEEEQAVKSVLTSTCTVCGTMLQKVMDASVTICPNCGVSEPYLESTRSGLAFNEDVEFVNNTYKRQNHFQEWLNQVQARETAPIPDDIIRKISVQLYQSGTRKTSEITRPKVRAALKALRLRRYYENISSILCQLTGLKPRRLLKHEENQLKTMFLVIQKPFERHCPKDRSNFLSYSYILFKFCEITGLEWMLTYFKLLKGNDKLHKQDEVFRKICEDLDWPFTPSI